MRYGPIIVGSDDPLTRSPVESRMSRIAKNEMYFGRNIEPSEVADAITRVSHDDVVALSRELFSGRMSVALLGDVGQVAIDEALLSPA